MKTENNRTQVYLMPGMAAASSIFEHIILDDAKYELHFLEWEIPEVDETLKDYAKRMIKHIDHEHIILIGVSFGGIIVQEMAKFLKLKRLIIISSVKCHEELPPRMKFAARTGLFKILPTGLLGYVDQFEKYAVGDFLKKRARLYKQYISISDKQYIDWAIKQMLTWDCEKPDEKVIHIQGDRDEVFPLKNIKNAIVVKGGTHIMIVNRFRWFNDHLPELIDTGKLRKNEKTN